MDNGKVSAVLWKDGVASSILASATTASVVELVDTRVLETRAARRTGSTPVKGTNFENNEHFVLGHPVAPNHRSRVRFLGGVPQSFGEMVSLMTLNHAF